MKKSLILTLLLSTSIFATVNVATTYAYLGKITKEIGGNAVQVDVLSSPKFDPHFITPRPSLIGKLRREDMLIINGGQLEIGWLPPLIKSANNAKINPGQNGFLDVSGIVHMIDKPLSVSRAYGDIHPDGNPHFITDIHTLLPIGKLISLKLASLDPEHTALYQSNYEKMYKRFIKLTQELDEKMRTCKYKKVVQYHQLFNYVLKANDIKSIGTIEPLPGISPSSKHTLELIQSMKEQGVKTILQDVYHEQKTAAFIASHTGANLVILPHDVGAVEGADTLEDFYRTIANRLCP